MRKKRHVGVAAPGGDERAMQAVLLHRQGASKRSISRAHRCGRNTVTRLLTGHEERRKEGTSVLPTPSQPRPSKLDAYADTIAALLKKYPDITAQRVFEELRAKDYSGGYTIVREYVLGARPKAPVISLPGSGYTVEGCSASVTVRKTLAARRC